MSFSAFSLYSDEVKDEDKINKFLQATALLEGSAPSWSKKYFCMFYMHFRL